jgi:3-deoxy-D-manno-octulosonic-acid transferase
LPVITGSSLFNFQAVSEQLLQAGGMICIADAQELAEAVNALLAGEEKAATMKSAALAVVEKNQGASDRNLNEISELLLLQALKKAAGH